MWPMDLLYSYLPLLVLHYCPTHEYILKVFYYTYLIAKNSLNKIHEERYTAVYNGILIYLGNQLI